MTAAATTAPARGVAAERTLRVRSNVDHLGEATLDGWRLEHRPLAAGSGPRDALRDYLAARDDDFVVVDTDTTRLLWFCVLSLVVPRRFRLVSRDIVLSRPRTLRQRLVAAAKRLLLRRVSFFVLYHHDLSGYARSFGITPERARIIPFKVNLWETLQAGPLEVRDDGFLLQLGRTYRDIPTFIAACARSAVPSVLLRQPTGVLRAHGTHLADGVALPPTLREVVDEGGRESWLTLLTHCRAVVLPIQPDTICNAGISTVLDAMALGKPVIISRGSATEGFIDESQAVLVPPGDPDALAAAMRRVHDDAGLRDSLSAAGRSLAASVQGAARLNRDTVAILGAEAERTGMR